MKKRICIYLVLMAIVALTLLSSCKTASVDASTNKKAVIRHPGGATDVIELKEWKTHVNRDEVTLTSKDGVVYTTHLSNVLIIEGE